MPNFNLDDYVQVNERVATFRKDHPEWGLLAKILVDDGQRIVMEATVFDEEQRPVARGHAEEIRGQGMVNKTSALENAETSAWGRALANLGLHVSRSLATREEVQRAREAQSSGDGSSPDPRIPAPVAGSSPDSRSETGATVRGDTSGGGRAARAVTDGQVNDQAVEAAPTPSAIPPDALDRLQADAYSKRYNALDLQAKAKFNAAKRRYQIESKDFAELLKLMDDVEGYEPVAS